MLIDIYADIYSKLNTIKNDFTGVKSRYTLLNYLIKKFAFESYLEIGVQRGLNLKRIKCKTKIGVDPNPLIQKVKAAEIIKTTSDNFFSTNTRTFDIIFIDGLHTHEQSYLDFINASEILNPDGRIVLHDCNPISPERAISFNEGGKWNGDVYKTIMKINSSGEYTVQTIDIDNGCGVIELKPSGIKFDYKPDYDWFDKNRNTAINLISWEEFIKKNPERIAKL